MDTLIKKLKTTTFFGRRFTRKQLADIQSTVATFPALSRKELAQTICEHLRWRTPNGNNRVAAALGLLQHLEQAGIVKLPPKQGGDRRLGPRRPPPASARSDPQPLIQCGLPELQPLRLLPVEQAADVQLFNECVCCFPDCSARQLSDYSCNGSGNFSSRFAFAGRNRSA